MQTRAVRSLSITGLNGSLYGLRHLVSPITNDQKLVVENCCGVFAFRVASPIMGALYSVAHPSEVSSNVVKSMWAAAYSKYPYASIVKFQFDVWENFKDYEGKVEYYFFGRTLGHGGVCFRIPGTDTAAQAELVVSELDAYHGEMRWYILVQTTKKWKPQHNDDVQVSTYAWHTGTVLHMVHNFANAFKQYHILFNNCNKWKTNIVTYMRDNGPPKNLTRPNCLEDLIRQCKKQGVSLEVFVPKIDVKTAE